MANNSINLVDLDPNTIKANLISYLKNQDQFKDYDFEGSNMSVLMDILAMNTFKNAFFMNMTYSETFLDSAQLPSSVFSRAKELNYTPRSKRSAKAVIDVTFTANGASQPYLIPKGSTFTSIVKNDMYMFTTDEPITVSSANSTFNFRANVYEGSYVQDSYRFNSNIQFPRFKITNKDVDTTSLTVVVFEDNKEVGDNYNLATTLLGLNENSKVFFLQTSENGYYEILFGDNILGRKPKHDSIVVLDYRIAKGAQPNGAKVFSINFDPTNPSEELEGDVEIETVSTAQNGAEQEDIESVRFYAPRHFQVQERAVNNSDYEILLKTRFPEINSVSVYGGEEAVPPRYGRVFVAVDIADVDGLPDSKKNEYAAFLKERSPFSIEPIFVEPDFIYYKLESTVRYNLNVSSNSKERIRTLVTNAILNYDATNLNDFNSTLRYSKLVKAIDEADASIVSNQTELHVYRKINPTNGVAQNISLDFGLAIKETDYVSDMPTGVSGAKHQIKDSRSLHSTRFKLNGETCLLEDDGAGNIRVVKVMGDYHYVIENVGTINYKTGRMLLTNFRVDTYEGNALKIYVSPKDLDIRSGSKTILTLEPSEIYITPEVVRV